MHCSTHATRYRSLIVGYIDGRVTLLRYSEIVLTMELIGSDFIIIELSQEPIGVRSVTREVKSIEINAIAKREMKLYFYLYVCVCVCVCVCIEMNIVRIFYRSREIY